MAHYAFLFSQDKIIEYLVQTMNPATLKQLWAPDNKNMLPKALTQQENPTDTNQYINNALLAATNRLIFSQPQQSDDALLLTR